MWSGQSVIVSYLSALHIVFRENEVFLKKIFPYCSSMQRQFFVMLQRLPYEMKGVNVNNMNKTKLIVVLVSVFAIVSFCLVSKTFSRIVFYMKNSYSIYNRTVTVTSVPVIKIESKISIRHGCYFSSSFNDLIIIDNKWQKGSLLWVFSSQANVAKEKLKEMKKTYYTGLPDVTINFFYFFLSLVSQIWILEETLHFELL